MLLDWTGSKITELNWNSVNWIILKIRTGSPKEQGLTSKVHSNSINKYTHHCKPNYQGAKKNPIRWGHLLIGTSIYHVPSIYVIHLSLQVIINFINYHLFILGCCFCFQIYDMSKALHEENLFFLLSLDSPVEKILLTLVWYARKSILGQILQNVPKTNIWETKLEHSWPRLPCRVIHENISIS